MHVFGGRTGNARSRRLCYLAVMLTSAMAILLYSRSQAQDAGPSEVKGWPAGVVSIQYLSDGDHTKQPALFYKPAKTEGPVPLLVGLHSWSNDYLQPEPAYARWCIKNGWVFIHPNFRGPNERPAACGSDLVVADILSAVAYAKKQANIDPNRIYLCGCSGGGYAALLLAGRAPQVWAGVSAWVPIFDLAAWHEQSHQKKGSKYWQMLEKSCGGAPGASAAVDAEYKHRSPSTYMADAAGVPLDINTGIHDGHKGSVPVSHAMGAFNALASPADQIPRADIDYMVREQAIPASLRRPVNDPLYQRLPALFRRISGDVRITVFNGGHAILPEAALPWLAQQRKGQKAVWDVPASARGETPTQSPDAGK